MRHAGRHSLALLAAFLAFPLVAPQVAHATAPAPNAPAQHSPTAR